MIAAKKIILYANTAWYLYNFRLALIKLLIERGYDIVLIAPYDKYVKKLEDNDIRVITIDMDRSNLNPISEARVVSSLVKIIRRESPDVIFNFTIKCAVYGSLAARLSGVKRRINAIAGLGSVFSSDKKSLTLLKPFVILLLKLTLLGKYSKIILQNPDDVNLFLKKLNMPESLIVLIKGSGVNAEKFQENADNRTFPVEKIKVLFASRLLWAKGVEDFINVAKQLENDKKYQFLIAGEPDNGNPDAVSGEKLAEWESKGLIKALGHIDNMPELLGKVDLVVLPSVYGEGVPRILIEAAASALPIIAFDIPGSREIVINNKNGYLLPLDEKNQLTNKIQKLFSNRNNYLSMCKKSHKHFLNNFEEKNVLDCTILAIESTKPTTRKVYKNNINYS